MKEISLWPYAAEHPLGFLCCIRFPDLRYAVYLGQPGLDNWSAVFTIGSAFGSALYVDLRLSY